jgi:hypothetical protein
MNIDVDKLIQIEGYVEEMSSGDDKKDQDEGINLHSWEHLRISISFYKVLQLKDDDFIDSTRIGALEMFFDVSVRPDILLLPKDSPETFAFEFYVPIVETQFQLNLWTNDDSWWWDDTQAMDKYVPFRAIDNDGHYEQRVTTKHKAKGAWDYLINRGFAVVHNQHFNRWQDGGKDYYKGKINRWGNSL